MHAFHWVGLDVFCCWRLSEVLYCIVWRIGWGFGARYCWKSAIPAFITSSLGHTADTELPVCVFTGSAAQWVRAIPTHVRCSLLWSRSVPVCIWLHVHIHYRLVTDHECEQLAQTCYTKVESNPHFSILWVRSSNHHSIKVQYSMKVCNRHAVLQWIEFWGMGAHCFRVMDRGYDN